MSAAPDITARRRTRWADEFAIGRVFELRSASNVREAPCVIVTGTPGISSHSGCQIDEQGARHNWWTTHNHRAPSGLLIARPIAVWNFSPAHMKGGRIARRRPDLERFDETDIALIQYGHDLDFNRRVGGSPYMVSLLLIPGAVWTIFTAENWYERISAHEEMASAKSLLHGAYHRHAFGENRREAWATMHADADRLDEFEARYRAAVGEVSRTIVEIVEEVDTQGRTHTFGRGDPGPVMRSGGRKVHDPRNPCASYWSTS